MTEKNRNVPFFSAQVNAVGVEFPADETELFFGGRRGCLQSRADLDLPADIFADIFDRDAGINLLKDHLAGGLAEAVDS